MLKREKEKYFLNKILIDRRTTRALSEITEKCPLLSNQWSFFNSVNDMIFLISLRIFPEIMKWIILHNECLDDFKDGGPPWNLVKGGNQSCNTFFELQKSESYQNS